MSTSEQSNPPTKVYVENGKIHFLDSGGVLFDLYKEACNFEVIDKPKSTIVWKEKKIPFCMWEKLMGFLRWSQKEHESESVLILFYNKELKLWDIGCFPQTTMGMTVKLDTDNPEYIEIRKQWGKGWTQFGSIHHHCTAGAFQSGTDLDDEAKKTGLHITIGKIDQDMTEYHARVSYGGTMHNAILSDWVEIPDWYTGIPELLAPDKNQVLCATKGIEPKQEWKDKVKKETYQTTRQFTNNDFIYDELWERKFRNISYDTHNTKTLEPEVMSQVMDMITDIMDKNNLTIKSVKSCKFDKKYIVRCINRTNLIKEKFTINDLDEVLGEMERIT